MSSAVEETDVVDGLTGVVTLVRFGGRCDVQLQSTLAGLGNEPGQKNVRFSYSPISYSKLDKRSE